MPVVPWPSPCSFLGEALLCGQPGVIWRLGNRYWFTSAANSWPIELLDRPAQLGVERSKGNFVPDPKFVEVMDYIKSGVFGETFEGLLSSLEGNEGFGRGDYFCVAHDFPSYVEQIEAVDEHWKDQKKWVKSSIINTANSGKFSSDRTIDQYAREIWGIKPHKVTF